MTMKETDNIYIRDLKWDNVTLYIYVRCDVRENILFYLADKTCDDDPIKTQDHIIRDVSEDDDGFCLRINITQAIGNSFLDNGGYEIIAICGTDVYRLYAEAECAYKFPDLSRVFRYEEKKAYVISFYAEEYEDTGELLFVMASSFMKNNDNWRERREGVKGKVLSGLKVSTGHEHARKRPRILFMTETSDVIKGNLKAVYNRALERHLDDVADISVYARADVSEGIGAKGLVRLRSLISRQDIIILDDYAPVFSYLDPPKGARLVQLWHAIEGFKSVGYSRFGKDGSPHPAWSCHRKYTDVFVPHEDLIDVYSEVFGVGREVFRVCGTPRLDGFTDPVMIKEKEEKVLSLWPELKDKKVILFAPTYRGSGQRDAYYDYSKLDLRKIKELCKDDTIFAVKMHPFIQKKIDIPAPYADSIIDVSDYPEINDLYYIADLMITDYSSDYFEFALLRKPVLFYTYDRDLYQITRGVHRDIRETAPGKVCDTFDEVMAAIRDQDYDFDKTLEFCNRYSGILDHHAADEIIDELFVNRR